MCFSGTYRFILALANRDAWAQIHDTQKEACEEQFQSSFADTQIRPVFDHELEQNER